jgi:predicted MPP superfamily phosphohydrolase
LLFGVIAIGFVLNVYGIFQTRLPRVEKLELKTSKLPPQIDKIKIVQMSDVHPRFALNSTGLDGLAARIKKEDPDILVSTGDLFDKVNSDRR